MFNYICYSHLKHLTAIPKQIIIMVPITAMGKRTFSVGNPRNVAFINCMPCVNGKIPIIFCIATGITSNGSVAPEKISMGKYKRHEITLALFIFLATPPTSKPILNVDTIVSIQLPKNKIKEPCIDIFQNTTPTRNKVSIDTLQYIT